MRAGRPTLREAFRPSAAYVAAAAAFVGHQVLQRAVGVELPWLDRYLDPFLAIPLLLGLAKAERHWLLGGHGAPAFTGVEIAAMTLALAVVFEELFPWLDPARQTRDGLDYLAYAAGGVAYALFRDRGRGGGGASEP